MEQKGKDLAQVQQWHRFFLQKRKKMNSYQYFLANIAFSISDFDDFDNNQHLENLLSDSTSSLLTIVENCLFLGSLTSYSSTRYRIMP